MNGLRLSGSLQRPVPGGLWPTLFLWVAGLLTLPVTLAQTPWRDTDQSPRPEPDWCERLPHQQPPAALIAVVQAAGQQLLLLDAAQGTTYSRCRLPVALQGAPRPSPDGRWLYWAASDGWVIRFDLQSGATLRTRTGLALQGLALSHDGRWLLAGHAAPHSAVLLDTDLSRVRDYKAQALSGGLSSAVDHVVTASARNSFVLTFTSLPEVWEISYSPSAEPIFDGLVHDYRMGEAIASPGFLGVRRTPLPQPREFIQIDSAMRHVLLTAPTGKPSADELDILNLDIRRRITTLALPQRPRRAAGDTFTRQGAPWVALVNEADGCVLLLDARQWRTDTRRLGPVCGVASVRTHAATPWLWISHAADTTTQDTLLLVDPTDGHTAHTLHASGAAWTPVQFSAGGRHALLSARGAAGSVRVVDSRSLLPLWQRSLPTMEAAYFLWGARPEATP